MLRVHVHKLLPRGWFKGGDTTALCLWLEHKFAALVNACEPEVLSYFQNILKVFRHANLFLKTLYNSDLFLTVAERDIVIAEGRGFLKSFSACASHAFLSLNLTRFKYQPKYHLLAEIIYRLEVERLASVASINVVAESTQLDEDFVGRCAKFSREVSARAIHVRTVKKYLLSLASLW